jgi:hypothetical protein
MADHFCTAKLTRKPSVGSPVVYAHSMDYYNYVCYMSGCFVILYCLCIGLVEII